MLIYGSDKNLKLAFSMGCKMIGFEHSFGKECWIKVKDKDVSKIKNIFNPRKIEKYTLVE
ncbi:unnamed protein product [marine sediment metagenome]|uniref:Uncharacterized protein n=1 Tax=marine sediment metagenome TaxID=412755 RepID=X1QGK7_9ZZZZ